MIGRRHCNSQSETFKIINHTVRGYNAAAAATIIPRYIFPNKKSNKLVIRWQISLLLFIRLPGWTARGKISERCVYVIKFSCCCCFYFLRCNQTLAKSWTRAQSESAQQRCACKQFSNKSSLVRCAWMSILFGKTFLNIFFHLSMSFPCVKHLSQW